MILGACIASRPARTHWTAATWMMQRYASERDRITVLVKHGTCAWFESSCERARNALEETAFELPPVLFVQAIVFVHVLPFHVLTRTVIQGDDEHSSSAGILRGWGSGVGRTLRCSLRGPRSPPQGSRRSNAIIYALPAEVEAEAEVAAGIS